MLRRTVAATFALALPGLAGCSFLRSDAPPKAVDRQVVAASFTGKAAGKLVVPRYCKLDTAIVIRPAGHPAVEEAAWRNADEQVVPLELRQALGANGLRIGVITGELPAEIADAFQEHPPLKTIDWVHFDLPEGVQTPITVRPRISPEESTEPSVVTLLVNRRGKVEGKDYADANGLITATADQKGSREVALRLVPSIQYGPKKAGYTGIQNAGAFAPQEFTFRSEQQEDARRDLAVTLDIQPGQYVVIGCRAQQERSLGSFLFSQVEPNTQRAMQSILLIQAGRNNVGAQPPTTDDGEKERVPLARRLKALVPMPDVPRLEPTPPLVDPQPAAPAATTAPAAAAPAATDSAPASAPVPAPPAEPKP